MSGNNMKAGLMKHAHSHAGQHKGQVQSAIKKQGGGYGPYPGPVAPPPAAGGRPAPVGVAPRPAVPTQPTAAPQTNTTRLSGGLGGMLPVPPPKI